MSGDLCSAISILVVMTKKKQQLRTLLPFGGDKYLYVCHGKLIHVEKNLFFIIIFCFPQFVT